MIACIVLAHGAYAGARLVADVQEWSEQSGYTRSWSPSPAAGGHPLRLRGTARSLPRLALYVLLTGVVLTAAIAILNALTS